MMLLALGLSRGEVQPPQHKLRMVGVVRVSLLQPDSSFRIEPIPVTNKERR